MFSRRRLMQRLFAWLALVAMGLASFVPVVSQIVIAPMGTMEAMADMVPDCHGHATPPASRDNTGHGGMAMEACGYCSFLTQHPGLLTVPVILMRSPALSVAAVMQALPSRPALTTPFFDAPPRGPPPF